MKSEHAFLRRHGWTSTKRPVPIGWLHPRLGHPWPTKDALTLTHEALAGDERAAALLGLEAPTPGKAEALGFVEAAR